MPAVDWGKWRLLIDGPASAPENMAVDESVMLAHAGGEVPPTLRFYRWNPPAVSIGYFQSAGEEINLAALKEKGMDLVRRPTGGRAVLHLADLTYSVVVREECLPGSVLDTYRTLSRGLVQGLNLLGVEAELAPELKGKSGPAPAACFALPSSYELVAGGKKLVGSAQVRKRGTILQHGSILLDFDPRAYAQVLGKSGADVEKLAALLAARVISLKDILGFIPPCEQVTEALCRGMASVLGVEFMEGELTSRELAEKDRLIPRYAGAQWNFRS